MTSFHDLHRPGDPLLLPNAWDVASAHALEAAGFAAVGTTSLGVTAAAGLPDGCGAGRDETLDLVRRVKIQVPLTVDIENGFGTTPDEVAAFAATLHEAGAAGINLEDGRPDGTLTPIDAQAAVITAIRRRVPDLFVNARTDTHWQRIPAPGETLKRAEAYRSAGAHGVFVPGLTDEAEIRTLSVFNLNVLLRDGMTVAKLAALGVARISTGSMLFRAALAAAVRTASEIAVGGPAPTDLPTYAEVSAAFRL
ncbi:MAG: isocitrate lyase/phosphoenolpyruvate mutase family protein [Actinoplanes sp.]